MVETCKIEEIKANCGSKFTSIMLAQNICSKYTRKRIQEMEQRLGCSVAQKLFAQKYGLFVV